MTDPDKPMHDQDDDVIRVVEDGPPAPDHDGPGWKVAIIDDDPAIHSGTRYSLSDYELNGARLELFSAMSAAEGRQLLAEHPDMAVILLDVVMESDGAGLDLVQHIRNELKNDTVRIILRTGQPGQAPERQVIVDYDINDYKAKTELTSDKLFTALTAAIRSYQQLMRLVETRRGLELIVDAASELFDLKSMRKLAAGVLTQIGSLVRARCEGILVLREDRSDGYSILAGSGIYARSADKGGDRLDPAMAALVKLAFERRRHAFEGAETALYIETASGREVVVALRSDRPLTETDRTLVAVFCGRLSTAFDNVILYEQLQAANETLEQRVTERTRQLTIANERLTAQWARLKRTNDHKAEVLGTVAHDLKNPLGVILGRSEMMGELLVQKPPLIERALGQIEQVRASVARMTAMVDGLINDAMLDAEDIVLRPSDVDWAILVQAVIDGNSPLAARKGQTLIYSGPESLPGRADPDRMREAVDNLVSNAIKYSPAGGRIRVILSADEGGHKVAVTDSGPGLSPEDQARLFGRFQRLSARPTGGESSTGLGLFISRRIVELHGGRIAAESEGAGRGATFTIIMPPAVQGAPS
ncbi:ATP-binding response regulator [Phreatobacter sp.]|uniref:ATP-binding response regulator n=1 Tax=Phreatobacter sp. TaxID=1966341 RepID=UPI003F710201